MFICDQNGREICRAAGNYEIMDDRYSNVLTTLLSQFSCTLLAPESERYKKLGPHKKRA